MSVRILGISAHGHCSAAALVCDGEIVAAAREEHFTRRPRDGAFPGHAISYCLQEAMVTLAEIDYVVIDDRPRVVSLPRDSRGARLPAGLRSALATVPAWRERFGVKAELKRELRTLAGVSVKSLPPLQFVADPLCRAASAFFPGAFTRAAVICLDGMGDWSGSSVWSGAGNRLTLRRQIDFPHSLGLLHAAFTHYAGFDADPGASELMTLASHGEPIYVDRILEHLLDVKEDGTFRLNTTDFEWTSGRVRTDSRFEALFGGPPRAPGGALTRREVDLARSVQVVTEEVALRLARNVRRELGEENLCLAGGAALNGGVNGRLLREGLFSHVWIQPAADAAGGALGAALSAWHEHLAAPRHSAGDSMRGGHLGPWYGGDNLTGYLDTLGAVYRRLDDDTFFDELCDVLTADSDRVVGWFHGRAPFGPLSLGGRCIIGDPRSATLRAAMNRKIPGHKSFQPLVAAIKAERVREWFGPGEASCHVPVTLPLTAARRLVPALEQPCGPALDGSPAPASLLPGVADAGYSARVQAVHAGYDPRFHRLLDRFERRTGCPIVAATGFSMRGEATVNTPADAYRCFMRTGMDCLVLEDLILYKQQQPLWEEQGY